MLNFLLVGIDGNPEFAVGYDIAKEELILGYILGLLSALIIFAIIKEFRYNLNKDKNSTEDKNDDEE